MRKFNNFEDTDIYSLDFHKNLIITPISKEGKRILYSDSDFTMLIIEAIIILIFPWPGFNLTITIEYPFNENTFIVHQLINDYFLAFMFFRLLLMVRTVYYFSIYSDAYARKICA